MHPLQNRKVKGPEWEEGIALSERGVGFWKNTIVRALLVLALLLAVGNFVLLWYFIRPTESGTPIVLHYNVYFGVDLLGAWWQAYIFPFLNVCFLLGHTGLAWRFYAQGQRIAAYLLLLSALFFGIAVLVAVASVVFINY